MKLILTQEVAGLGDAGDIVEVTLEVDSTSEHGWVVIDDPVPAGTTFLGRGFNTDGDIGKESEEHRSATPSFVERTFQNYRAYFESLGRGKSVITYRIRLNQAGLFHPPPTRVEAMYQPEVFGELPQEAIRVAP